MVMLALRKRLLCCCVDFDDCPATTITFDDATYGPLANTGADPPWELDHIDHPGQLAYQQTADAELLWTVPVVDLGIRTQFQITATVIGDGSTDNDGGGVTIPGTDWQAWWGLEGGRLILRYLDTDDQFREVVAAENVPTGITLTLTAASEFACRGWTRLTGTSFAGHTASVVVRKDIEVASFPADATMGVFVPSLSSSAAGDSPFPAVCPVGEVCHGAMTATGSFANGNCGCSPSAESASRSTTALSCGGTPLSSLLTGFDPADGYYIADLPFAEFFGAWSGWKAILYYDGADLRCVVIDNGNCPQWFGTLVSTGCDPFTARFEFSELVLSCCEDSIGNAYIDWSMPQVTCPIETRAFDGVILRACAGLIPECEFGPTYATECGDSNLSHFPQTMALTVAGMPADMACFNGQFTLSQQMLHGHFVAGASGSLDSCGNDACGTWWATNEDMRLGTLNGRALYNGLHFADLGTCERDESQPGIAYDAPGGSCFSTVFRVGYAIRETVPSSGVFDKLVFLLFVGTTLGGHEYESEDFPYPSHDPISSMTFTKLGTAPATWPATITATAAANMP